MTLKLLTGTLSLNTNKQTSVNSEPESKVFACLYQNYKSIDVQSNLDNSNADFSKLPDFSKTSDGPKIFLYCLLLNYY